MSRYSASAPGPRDRLAVSLVVLLVCYVPVVALSLCQIEVPLLLMGALYAAPPALLALGWAWFRVRRRAPRRPAPRGLLAHG